MLLFLSLYKYDHCHFVSNKIPAEKKESLPRRSSPADSEVPPDIGLHQRINLHQRPATFNVASFSRCPSLRPTANYRPMNPPTLLQLQQTFILPLPTKPTLLVPLIHSRPPPILSTTLGSTKTGAGVGKRSSRHGVRPERLAEPSTLGSVPARPYTELPFFLLLFSHLPLFSHFPSSLPGNNHTSRDVLSPHTWPRSISDLLSRLLAWKRKGNPIIV
jgi:hypothetical protein